METVILRTRGTNSDIAGHQMGIRVLQGSQIGDPATGKNQQKICRKPRRRRTKESVKKRWGYGSIPDGEILADQHESGPLGGRHLPNFY